MAGFWNSDVIFGTGLAIMGASIAGHVICGITGGVGLSRGGAALEELGADYSRQKVAGYWVLYGSQAIPYVNIATIPSVPLFLYGQKEIQLQSYEEFTRKTKR